MKRLVFSVMVILVFASLAISQQPTVFYWDPPTTNTDGSPLTDLAGFRLYCGDSSGNYRITADVPDPDAIEYLIGDVLPADSDQTWFCTITAYDDMGNESAYSNEISFPFDLVPPDAAQGLGVR